MPTPLSTTAQSLLADNRGILAMDESGPTCDKRFAALGIPLTLVARQAYRELLVTAPGLGESISGAILYDETIRQRSADGRPFTALLAQAGIIPGIKVDLGAHALAGHVGEHITDGLDGLRERLHEYAAFGARFAKWRAVIAIAAGLPSRACIAANAHALARYAALCQEAGVVPMVEPEVLMDGDHSLERCGEVTEDILHALFAQLHQQGVDPAGTILKVNMIVPGAHCPDQSNTEKIAAATVRCLRRNVPAALAGVAFLSGGQEAVAATERLDAINRTHRASLPWPVTFSYARALQQPALEAWRGQAANVPAAQRLLVHRATCNRLARAGKYDGGVEKRAGVGVR